MLHLTKKNEILNFYNSNILLQNLLENSPHSAWIADADGIMRIINSKFSKFWNIRGEDVIDKYCIFTDNIIKENNLTKQIKEVFNEGKTTAFSLHKYDPDKLENISLKNSIERLLDVTIAPIINNENKIIGAIIQHFDLTDKFKKLQEQLIQSERLAAVGQLTAGIAHEFNNILTIALGNIQLLLLKNNKLPEKCVKSMKTIEAAISRGKNIVSDMINFSKPKPPDKKTIDIADIIERIIVFQKNMLEFEHIKIEKVYKYTSKVNVDIGQMEQVLLNLIINARHAIIPKNQGIIKIEIYEHKNTLEINIEDNGIGMSDEIQKKIFTPFFSTKGAYAKNNYGIDGSGLGLAVSYTVIQNHGGTISFQSEENIGTKFKIILPLKKKSEICKIGSANHIKKTSATKKLNFLIVDDEQDILDILQQILEMNNCSCCACSNGKRSIELTKDNNFDAIFLDMLLPDMNGINIIEEIRKFNKNISIIIISGKANPDIAKLKEFGVDTIIEKPFRLDDIEQAIEKIKLISKT